MAITYRTVKGSPLTWQELDDNFAEVGIVVGQAEDARDAAILAKNDAEAAAIAAENEVDDFETKYLGAKTSPPTVDNKGNPLIDGALYYNTNTNVLSVYDLDTTMWVAIGGDMSAFVQKSGDTMTGVLKLISGSAATPSLASSNDSITGMYMPSTGTIAFTTGGANRVTLTGSAFSSTVPVRVANGSVGSPSYSFTSDTNTGMYLLSSDALALVAGGTARLTMSTTAITAALAIGGIPGTASLPGYTFSGDVDTGFYRIAEDNLGIAVGGVKKVDVSTTGVTFTDVINTPMVVAGSSLSLRNKVINGNFRIWQRALAQTSAGYGSADRWFNYHNGVGVSKTINGRGVAAGDPSLPSEFGDYLETVFTSGSDVATEVTSLQRIEDVRTLANKTVTVSLWARSPTALKLGVNLTQGFGTGGSTAVHINGQSVTLTSVFQRYTFTFTVPSVQGKTLGSNDHALAVYLWMSAGSSMDTRSGSIGLQSGQIDVTGVQVEEGPVATPFEFRPVQVELALCQRYYEAGQLSTMAGCYAANSWLIPFRSFSAVKRASPTVVATATNPPTLAGAWTAQPHPEGFRAIRTATGSPPDLNYLDGTWTADAEL